jgi:hypothetical protein
MFEDQAKRHAEPHAETDAVRVISPISLELLTYSYVRWENMANDFRAALEGEELGLLNWRAWKMGKSVRAAAKDVERLADVRN